ncbi:AAA domain-containing protein [Corynebacterium glucuronolyticum]|uniref:AAA domain-containing protein n=1 Tax=Corynebacterium glucuronolyticum TaxID=39791 RepID=UPI00019C1915|nr:AAA domain-containing protein [Corynebacterium glucuronolyticum]EEI27821.1 exonuclease, DNA polymerase III, epsilon subunit family [Corynebacterium glucuronolyticum ATCC 51867]QRO82076.1 DUF4011 domain-containing protein [Corynebacterium glucuronolyticum]
MSQLDDFEFRLGEIAGNLHYRNGTNFALAHNGVPVAYSITFTNLSDSVKPEMDVHIACTCYGEDLFPPSTIHVPSLGAYETTNLSLTDSTKPKASLLWELQESDSTDITLTSSAEGKKKEISVPLRLLAYNEWFNSHPFFESLAAFVQPNDSKLIPLLRSASQALIKETGSSSLNGYQQGSKHAVEIAAAIYVALGQEGITYITPPASFENTGQRVRSSSEVILTKFGTCIDLSIAFSAVAEQTGLHPVIILLKGHAMTGIITQDQLLRKPVIEATAELRNLITSGTVLPIDSVSLTSDTPQSFSNSVSQARRILDEAFEKDEVYGIVDIASARQDGMRPLSSGGKDSYGEEEISTGRRNKSSFGKLGNLIHYADEIASSSRLSTEKVPPRIANWMKELLDLTFKNRLLNTKPGAEVIELLTGGGILPHVDDLIHNGTNLAIEPHDAISLNKRAQGFSNVREFGPEYREEQLLKNNRIFADITEKQYKSKLTKLSRTVATLREETGSSNFYLALGSLQIPYTKGSASAPLFLIPIKFTGGKGNSRFGIQIDSSQEATPNHCLVEWLRQNHDLTIPALEHPYQDESGLDIARNISEISKQLADSAVDLEVTENAFILIAKFSTYGMWRDLKNNWRDFEKSPVFHHLTHNPGRPFEDPAGNEDLRDIDVVEGEVFLPISADGAQLKAVAAAGSGRSFVLEGPPGTGKSQTITNLVAHCLAEGQKVLFVAEKQAALDVVKSRLESIGLAPFTLDLHGSDQHPDLLRKKLRDSIDTELIYNNRRWKSTVVEFQSRIQPLTQYPEQIHTANAIGYSLWTAATEEIMCGHGPTLPVPRSYVTNPSEDVSSLGEKFHQLSLAAIEVSREKAGLWFLAGPGVRNVDSNDIMDAWSELWSAYTAVQQNEVAKNIATHYSKDFRNSYETAIARILEITAERKLTNKQRKKAASSLSYIERLAHEADMLAAEAKPVTDAFSVFFLRSGNVQELIDAGEAAQQGFFGKKKRLKHFYDLCAAACSPAFSAAVMSDDPPSPNTILSLARKIPTIRTADTDFRGQLAAIQETAHLADTSVASYGAAKGLRHTAELISKQIATAKEFPDLFDRSPNTLRNAVPLADRYYSAWQNFLTTLTTSDEQFKLWLDGKPWALAIRDQLPKWKADIDANGVSTLRNVAQWNEAAVPLSELGFEEAVLSILGGEVPLSEIDMALLRGLARASLVERIGAFKLDNFSVAEKDDQLLRLKRAVKKLQSELKKSLPAKLQNQRHFKPGRVSGKTGDLRRRLESKRKMQSFRNLFNDYSEQILDITPCILASPTALAHFIAPKAAAFDIVVFDEASQVTVDQAVGALGRGKSAVIVGDSKQMPPTSFGKASSGNITDDYVYEEESDPSDVGDLDSILTEAVESGFPRLWLTWHYRSQDESLIAFSNKSYYDGKLASLPSPGGSTAEGVTVHRVNGQFLRANTTTGKRKNTNPIEAQAIVEEITRRLNDPFTSEESIGVVTFNVQQRDLILDLLEASEDPLVHEHLQPGPDGIFVKNLENVQGDERDVILFSVAFSKKEDGGPMPLNFGPLNRMGGERRLNVAITRARRSVVMFVSFDPHEIDPTRTNSRGLKDLREYIIQAQKGFSRTDDSTERLSKSETDDHIRDAIAKELRKHGWVVQEEYGLSSFKLDLVVRPENDERWHVAVILDGPRWNTLPTVADRDLTPELLKPLMSWAGLVRVWLPEWIHKPQSVITRIENEIAKAQEVLAARDEEAEEENLRRELELEEKKSAALDNYAQQLQEEEEEEDIENEELSIGATDSSEPFAFSSPLDETMTSPVFDAVVADPPVSEHIVADLSDYGETEEEIELPSEQSEKELTNEESVVTERQVTETVPSFTSFESPQEKENIQKRKLIFKEPQVRNLGKRAELQSGVGAAAKSKLKPVIRNIISNYGPMETTKLYSHIAKCFGLSKAGANIRHNIAAAIPADSRITERIDGEGFIWPNHINPQTWIGFRASSIPRYLASIPLEEIANAIEYSSSALRYGYGLSADESEMVYNQVLKLFGIQRGSSVAEQRFNEALLLASERARKRREVKKQPSVALSSPKTKGRTGASPSPTASDKTTGLKPAVGDVSISSKLINTPENAKHKPTLGFAVLNVKTSGISERDRIIEIGIVLATLNGKVEGTYTTLINPRRSFSDSAIHGISERMTVAAPVFEEVADDIAELLDRRILIAHDAPFVSKQLGREFSRSNVKAIHLNDGYCTMSHSPKLLGSSGRSLSSALDAAGLKNEHSHCALDDAMATANLLNVLLHKGAIAAKYPAMQFVSAIHPRRTPTVTREFVEMTESTSWISQIIDQLPTSGEADIDEFMQLLDIVMLDREVSTHERLDLYKQAVNLGLSQQDINRARMQYLRQVIRIALSDSVLSEEEIEDINRVAEVLEIDQGTVSRMISAMQRSSETSDAPTFALQPGDRIAFTGPTVLHSVGSWEKITRNHSLVVADLDKSTVILVAADPDTMNKKAQKARNFKIPIINEQGYDRLLRDLESRLEE